VNFRRQIRKRLKKKKNNYIMITRIKRKERVFYGQAAFYNHGPFLLHVYTGVCMYYVCVYIKPLPLKRHYEIGMRVL